jgi:hypothetical protein
MGMRTILEAIPTHLVTLIEQLRGKLMDAEFLARHRVRPQDFTRQQQLTFPVLMLFVLQKTVKSIQRHLHEFLEELTGGAVFESVTPGAVTHARAKLKPTAFIELNQQTVLPVVYAPEQAAQLKRWRGHRLVGHDSSLIRLPASEELGQQFGWVEVTNKQGATGTRYPEARISVLYDLLNRIGLDARLEPSGVGEVRLALEQLAYLQPADVAINDRGFTGYRFLAEHIHRDIHVVGRCSQGSFAAAQQLFRMDRAGRSLIVKLVAPREERAELKRLGLPLEIVVRFVSVRLPTGGLEVLVTTLLDQTQYPTEEFEDLYHCRWGHETYYGALKGRLDLENFSGETVEAVQQDFHAAVLLCNLESLLTRPAVTTVTEASTGHKHSKQVNRANSYHALKQQLLDLLYSDLLAQEVISKLQLLFVRTPVSVRRDRKVPRRKPSFPRSYHFQRRVKKVVF